MPYAFISAGSSTRVKDGPGLLKSVWIMPASGGSLVIADNPNLGAGGPDFNALTSVTSTITNLGVWPATPSPTFFDAFATRFQNGLSIAASSSARVTVLFE